MPLTGLTAVSSLLTRTLNSAVRFARLASSNKRLLRSFLREDVLTRERLIVNSDFGLFLDIPNAASSSMVWSVVGRRKQNKQREDKGRLEQNGGLM